MADIQQVVRDPNFLALPTEERRKVMLKIDPNFAALPEPEQVKAAGLIGVSRDLPPESAMYGYPSTWKGPFSRAFRGTSQAVGSTVGSIVGAGGMAPTGPGAAVGGVVGGGIGYAAGSSVADIVDEKLGLRESPSLSERTKEAATDVAIGTALEMIGPAFVPVYRGGKWIFKNVAPALIGGTTGAIVGEQSMGTPGAIGGAIGGAIVGGAVGKTVSNPAKRAAQQLVAHFDFGDIYAKNEAEAKAIEAQFPGVKFTLAQRTDNPNLVLLEQSQTRTTGTSPSGEKSAANVLKESRRSNTEALIRGYESAFPEKEGMDDLYDFLNATRTDLKAASGAARDALETEIRRGTIIDPLATGKSAREAISTAELAAKKRGKDLYERIGDAKVDAIPLMEKIKDLKKPWDEFEGVAENVPGILGAAERAIAKMSDDGGPANVTLKSLQTLRSNVLDEIRSIESSKSINYRYLKRLTAFKDSIEETMSNAESGLPELRAANDFWRKKVVPFYQGKTKDVLGKERSGEFSVPDESVIPSFFRGKDSLSAAKEFKKNTGNTPYAKGLVRDYASYDLATMAINRDTGEISEKKINDWLKKNWGMLEEFGLSGEFNSIRKARDMASVAAKSTDDFEKTAAAKLFSGNGTIDAKKVIPTLLAGKSKGAAAMEIYQMTKGNPAAWRGAKKMLGDYLMDESRLTMQALESGQDVSRAKLNALYNEYEPAIKIMWAEEPHKIRAMLGIRQALDIMVRNEKSPIGKGSITAETIWTKLNKINILNRVFSIAKAGYAIVKSQSDKDVNDYLTRALFDPDYADELVKGITGKTPPKMFEAAFKTKIANLRNKGIAATGAGILGALEGDDK